MTNPTQKLTVVGNISAKAHPQYPAIGSGHIYNDGDTITKGILSVTSNAYLSSNASVGKNLSVNSNTLYVSAGSGGRGRVGINTNIPSNELAVDGSGYFTGSLDIDTNLTVNTTTNLKKALYVQNTGLVALSGTGGVTRVGINVTPNASSFAELTIKGSLSASKNLTVNGGVTADGNLYNKGTAKIDGEVTLGTVNRTFDSTSTRVAVS